MVVLQLGSVYSGGVGVLCLARPGRGDAGVVVVVVRVRFADVWWAGGAGWGSGLAWLGLQLWAAAAWWVGSLGVGASIRHASITAARRAGWDGGWLSSVGSSVGGPFRPSVLSSSSSCYLRRRFGPPPSMVHRSSRGSRTDLVSRRAAGSTSSHARQQDRPHLTPDSRTVLISRPAAGPCLSRAQQQDRALLAPGAPDGSMEASFGRPIGFRRWGRLKGAKGGPFRPYLWLGLRWFSSEVVSRSRMPGWRPWWWFRGAHGQSPWLGAARWPWSCGRHGRWGVAPVGGECWPG